MKICPLFCQKTKPQTTLTDTTQYRDFLIFRNLIFSFFHPSDNTPANPAKFFNPGRSGTKPSRQILPRPRHRRSFSHAPRLDALPLRAGTPHRIKRHAPTEHIIENLGDAVVELKILR